MRLAFFGDVVGRSGREAIADHLPRLKRDLAIDFCVINAENAANGFGITESTAKELYEAGADCLTLGNHSWDQKEALTYIVREPRLLRPANYPVLADAPGRGANLFETASGKQILVINVLGRVFMDALDDPFAVVDKALSAAPLRDVADAVIVDVHAEATSEKMAMGHFCDGRASLVVGTHSHVPTADAQILNGGTAYQTDAGACADYDSVIGNQKEEPIRRFTTRISGGRYQPATGPATMCGVFVETDDATGLAVRIEPIRVGGRLKETVPAVRTGTVDKHQVEWFSVSSSHRSPPMSDVVYSAHAHTVGGRAGTARTDDGKLDVKLAYPPQLGGDGNGTNPEQLFACGYGACFTGALGLVARNEKVQLGDHSVDVTVDLIRDAPSFKIGVTLTLNAPALDRGEAERLLKLAHEVCPYSKATRNNVDVKLAVA